MIEIVDYGSSWVAAHEEFATRMWPWKSRRHNEHYIRWKFRGGDSESVPGFLLAVDEGKVIGQLGVIPVELCVDGHVYPAQWACDLMVDERERRRGIARQLFETAMSRNMITLGSDPSPLAQVSMAKIGFGAMKGPWKYLFPIDPRHAWRLKFGDGNPVLKLFFCMGMKLRSRYFQRRLPRMNNHVHVKERPSIDETVKLLVATQGRRIRVPHDESFVCWRCRGLDGFVKAPSVVLAEGSFAITDVAGDFFYLYEWHAENETSFASVQAELLALAVNAGAQTIQAFANDAKQARVLSRFGYIKMRTRTNIVYHDPFGVIQPEDELYYCIYDSDGNL